MANFNSSRIFSYSRPVICVRSEESLLRKLCSCEAKNTHQPSVPVPLNCSFSNKDHNNYNNDNNNLSRFLYATFFSAGLVIGLLAAFLFYKVNYYELIIIYPLFAKNSTLALLHL